MARFRKALEDKSETELIALSESPDYCLEAQEEARSILQSRGLTDDKLTAWRPSFTEDIFQSFLRNNSTPGQILSDKRRRKFVYLLTLLSLPAALPLAMMLGYAVTLLGFSFEYVDAVVGVGLYASLAIFIAFNGPLWKHPARIVVLRPFGMRYGNPLRRLLKRCLRYYGHVYTLSDETISTNRVFLLLEVLPYKLASLCRYRHEVTSDHHYAILHASLSERIARNLNWSFSADKIFKIHTSNAWWQHVVRVLINAADLVMVDLSGNKPGVQWELSELAHYRGMERAVFVASAELDTRLEKASMLNVHIFTYDNGGRLKDEKSFEDAILSIMASRSLKGQEPDETAPNPRLAADA